MLEADGSLQGGGGGELGDNTRLAQKKKFPDFRTPEVGISVHV